MIGALGYQAAKSVKTLVPLLILLLAGYCIWYCQTGLNRFSRLQRLTDLDGQLRLCLFQTESVERAYLLSGNPDLMASFEGLKNNLLETFNRYVAEMGKDEAPGTSRELEGRLRKRVLEMDVAIECRKTGELPQEVSPVWTNKESHQTAEFCSDLDGILASVRSRSICW